jgi:hypothetical protein
VQPGCSHTGLPPCLVQSPATPLRALVGQPGARHNPLPPCLVQSPRRCDLVGQPGCMHTRRVPPPCLRQSPCVCALVVHPGWTHTACVPPPCLPQSPPFFTALVLHPGTEQCPIAPCVLQSPTPLMAFVWHRTAEQTPYAPCFLHNSTRTAWLVQKEVEHVFLTRPLAAAFPPAPRVLLAPVDAISLPLQFRRSSGAYRATLRQKVGTHPNRRRTGFVCVVGLVPQTTVQRFLKSFTHLVGSQCKVAHPFSLYCFLSFSFRPPLPPTHDFCTLS